jgi:hypothetical protein
MVVLDATIPNMVGPDGSNIPAPWVSYTRAGCDFGAVATANTVLENTSTAANGDVTKVFGATSPQATEANASSHAASGSALANLAQTDLVGLAVHCAQNSPNCSTGEADPLPSEPGGYNGFNALFGAKQVNPIITGGAPVLNDLSGNPIVDPFGQPGFPGFDGMSAAASLSYIVAMQKHGIPVTYAYVSDAHDFHGVSGNAHNAYGPGDPGYVAQLQSYDLAFANFFTQLAAAGIDKTNTLFIFTVDEGDHFVGDAPSNPSCDGVNTPCNWGATTLADGGVQQHVGEISANIDTLVQNQFPALYGLFLNTSADAGPLATDNFTVHGDDAPTFYLSRRGLGPLSQTDPDTRNFERNIAHVTDVNPYTGNTDRLLFSMMDQAGQQAVHMFTAGDTARNPTFTFFADDNYFITDFPSSTCLSCVNPAFAWNHGDVQTQIGMTWLGFVGPGVRNQQDQTIFTDHTDVRPTIDSVLGLTDDYVLDGRVITQALQSTAYSPALVGNIGTMEALGDAYKQINAPFGVFSGQIIATSTVALQGSDPSDSTYTSLEAAIVSLTGQRDTLASAIKSALFNSEFNGTPISTTQAQTWIASAQAILASAQALASGAGGDAGAPIVDAGGQ